LKNSRNLILPPGLQQFIVRHIKRSVVKQKKVVHVVGASHLTSTISLAKTGARMAEEAIPGLKVELFDSGTFTTAQGFMALAAA
jgi:fatty acid-binding protein DegV